MQRLTCLLLLGAVLASAPVLVMAKVTGAPATVAVVSPPLSTANTGKGGCTPISPCALVTPALGAAALPAPEMPPQPDLPGTSDAPDVATPPTPAAAAPAPTQAANCPPMRGGLGRGNGRGANAAGGRQGAGDFRRFAQAGGRGGAGGASARGGFARGADGCPGQGRGRGASPAGRGR